MFILKYLGISASMLAGVVFFVIGFMSIIIQLCAAVWIFKILKLCCNWILKKCKPTFSETVLWPFGAESLNKASKIKWSFLIILTLIAFLFDSSAFKEIIGIHSLEDKGEGTYCYYAEVKRGNKEYTIPAEVHVVIDTYYEDVNGRSKYNKYKYYYIDKVYFSDGDYLDFSDEGDNYVTKLEETTRVLDQDGREWTCKLLDKHAYSPFVAETTSISVISVAKLLLVLVSTIYNLIGYLLRSEEEETE